ncbi:venom metalloproteinase antarease-like TtrivMP_A [Rhipicephalus sanguineus]|uniref:venom metalloproteinase antarease-like TtrivMP_A n=1 Tax=Rhipicephalus sanguineus TaxID=34632 RepID=UPI0018954FB7|nr:venom metalloproteinase antarease-like TtrivMP_A [Rhipicephalus sanguineus]
MVTSCLLSFYLRLLCFYLCLCAILQVTHCGKIPGEGTLVFPKLLESRDDRGTRLLKISDDLTLNLEKSSVMGKEFLLRTYQGHVMQHNYLDGEALEEDLYHDPKQFASVIVSEENGLQVEGVLGPKLAIKPFEGQGRSAGARDVPHLIYKIEDNDGVYAGKGVTVKERANISERQNQNGARPDTIYPELLLAVDSTFRAQFKTKYTLMKYLMITMNSVNVRYMTVSNPSVRLTFCALEILTVTQETFLLKQGKYVHALRTLGSLRDHVRNNTQKYSIYDGVYLITGLDMAEHTYYGWNGNLLGYAYIGGICTWQKVGYGEDTVGTFRGIRILAHEVGHLLGCPHDGQTSGYYTSANCPWNDGFIMRYMEIDSRSMKFSQCCNTMISWLAWSQTGACLLTATAKRKIKKKYYTKLFVGNIMTRDQICKMSFPNVPDTRFIADYNGFENCMARCFMPASVYGYETFMPTFLPDNSPCTENNGTRCRNGDCTQAKLRREQYKPYQER